MTLKMDANKKLIIHIEKPRGYEENLFFVSIDYATPYLAGSLGNLVSEDGASENKTHHHEHTTNFRTNLFNEAGYAKISLDIGKEGLYYLRLIPNHKLANLILDPPDIVVDVYYSMDFNAKTRKYDLPDNRLLYSFLNLSDQSVITIIANSIIDDENIYEKLRSNPTDIIWRQFFVKRAITPTVDLFRPAVKEKQIEEKKSNSILTADEAAAHLRIHKKTLQNLASQGKIKKLRGGKYRLEELDNYLESSPRKKR